MKEDKKIFSLIVISTVFAYLKEHYPHYELKDSDDIKDIETITDLLQQLEKYAHIPDKKRLVENRYRRFKGFIENQDFKEEEILSSLNEDAEGLTNIEKEDILNSVIFVVHADKNVSDKEKELILQISKFLGLKYSYNEIFKQYNKSEFKEEKFPLGLVYVGVLLLFLLSGFFYWKVQNQPKVQAFSTNKYQFDEITFNRYVMYKNQYEISNNDITNHFKKYAVYYISGTAQISFNPKKIAYDSLSKTLTLTEDFDVDLLISKEDEIDRVNAKPISKDEAQKLGVVVGIAGAYGGAKVGSGLSKFLSPDVQIMASAGGAIVGGATGYLVTSNALTNVKLTKDISITDKKETLSIGLQLIKAQLKTDERLIEIYKEHFETFIKAKYKALNKDVNEVNYSIVKKSEVAK